MKKYENFIRSGILLLAFTISPWCQAQVQQFSPSQLTDAVKDWLQTAWAVDELESEIHVTALDSRIGSKDCAHQPQISLPANANPRQTTVQISCSAPTSWQLFVPARLTEWLALVVSRQNIAPGTVITADMLEVQRRERRLVRGNIVQDIATVAGSRNKRSLSAGQILSLQDLCLVCRGDIVTIEISQGGLAVSATGVAQQDGTLGEVIQVRNQQSGRAISTEVTGVNQVKVRF